MMDTQFAKFLQIGIIVENVEETVKQYEKYGLDPGGSAHWIPRNFPILP